jgi:hypothetical protein
LARVRLISLLFFALALAACGGSPGSSKTPPPPHHHQAPSRPQAQVQPSPQGPTAAQADAIAVCSNGGGDTVPYNAGSVTLYSASTGASLGVRASGVSTLTPNGSSGGSFAPSVQDAGLSGTESYCDTLSYDSGLTELAGVVTESDSGDPNGTNTSPGWLDLNSGTIDSQGFVNSTATTFATRSSETVVLAAAFNPYNEDLWSIEGFESGGQGSLSYEPRLTVVGPDTSATYSVPSYVIDPGYSYTFEFSSAQASPTIWITTTEGVGMSPFTSVQGSGPVYYFALGSGSKVTKTQSPPPRPGYLAPGALPHSNYTVGDVRVADDGRSAAFVASVSGTVNENQVSLWSFSLPNGAPTQLGTIPITVDNPSDTPGMGVIRDGTIPALPSGSSPPTRSITTPLP